MAEHLKIFNTSAEYDAVVGTENEPNVSHIIESNGVEFKETDPCGEYGYVDLELPSGLLWATVNVGASSETGYGKYFNYGKGADDYLVTEGQEPYAGTENPLALSADTAAQLWGGEWHIPTEAQFRELTANTNFEISNGGYKFTSKTDSSKYILLPFNGYHASYGFRQQGSRGWYLSSTNFFVGSVGYEQTFSFVSYELWTGIAGYEFQDRAMGVRPVVG